MTESWVIRTFLCRVVWVGRPQMCFKTAICGVKKSRLLDLDKTEAEGGHKPKIGFYRNVMSYVIIGRIKHIPAWQFFY